jgi:hypothetical protein
MHKNKGPLSTAGKFCYEICLSRYSLIPANILFKNQPKNNGLESE